METESEHDTRVKKEYDYFHKHAKAVGILWSGIQHHTEYIRKTFDGLVRLDQKIDYLHQVFRQNAGHTADADWLTNFHALKLTSYTVGALT
ncbi:hypothetical protein HK101_005924, partial [Irineochytrium annulatum]